MQLYAFDSHNNLIPAAKALKGKDYTCPECQGTVRSRKGDHRKAHFFHYKSSLHCKLSGKSMIHLQVQSYLQNLLPEGECTLERPFPEISRIADAAWISKKIIFEIQCSPLPAEEVKARNADYSSLGYQVVWVLHDKQFNQYRLSGAESHLRNGPHYFTNIDVEGEGMIYDQFDIHLKSLRKKKMAPLAVDLSKPLTPLQGDHELKVVRMRSKMRPLHFSGDLLDMVSLREDYLQEAERLEREFFPEVSQTFFAKLKRCIFDVLIHPYRLLFQILLERSCR